MLKEERHNFILQEIGINRKVHSSSLSKKLEVSEDTIRRDLKELAQGGHVKKVHGGAMAGIHVLSNLKKHSLSFQSERLTIVNKALSFIKDHQVIIIDGDATNLVLAEQLPRDLTAVIITNSLPVATKLYEYEGLEIIFLGGKVSNKARSTMGLDVINALSDIHADVCLIEVSSIHPNIGITEADREKALTKKAIMKVSHQSICLCLSEAIGKVQPFRIEEINKIQTIVCELEPDDPSIENLKNKGVEVV